MLLSELLAAPALGLRVLHESPGSLGRPVGRVITTDLLEPGRYLTGGELVMTGLAWRQTADDSETFVASVTSRGATTVLAGDALLGAVPDDLVEACRRHACTLIEVPIEVAFADITEHVAATRSAVSGARLSRQRQLLSSLADGRTLVELAARVSTEVGRHCRVLTTTGRHIAQGPGELAPATLDALVRAFLVADRLPAVVRDDDSTYSLFPVGPGLGNRLTAWLVAVDGDHTEWPHDQVEAVQELCSIAAVDRSRRDEGVRALRPTSTDVLALVEGGAPHAEVAVRLRQAGLDPDLPVTVVVVDLDGEPDESALLLFEDVALAVGGSPVVAPGRDGRLVGILPASEDLADRLRTSFARLGPGTGRGRLAVGVSGEARTDAITGALEEARFAHRVARSGSAPVSVVGSEEVASHVLLLACVPDDVRRSYAQRVLGALLDHDRRTNADLVGTLGEFLACSGSWARTAESLHLHVNTVRYRIEKVQELTGRDLSRLEDRVDVFLALESLG
ncbi:PucR family transcriptional regulator [Nocardioides jensenii]|uniref:PucR family transcriptional regulator n=1 Tax=Nocardioides jensenii TaxID=1843 RepID=UPI000832E414|nr:PucR family transcriptional regulator [Nocardioides jensenii]